MLIISEPLGTKKVTELGLFKERDIQRPLGVKHIQFFKTKICAFFFISYLFFASFGN